MKSEMIDRIQAVRDGGASAVEIVRQRLRLLESENPLANAVVECHPEELIAQAQEIDRKAARGIAGKLAGAIVTVKDNLDVQNMRSTAGMEKLKDNVAEKDCDVVGRLRAQDALILGKTNMPPGAMDAQTDNPVYGRTNHPLFPERTCGGSSGGGACAVRLGISDMDIGNDIMGSIRIPAHFCGIYGFVPTQNAIYLDSLAGGALAGSTLSRMLRIGIQAREIDTIAYALPLLQKAGHPSCPGNETGVRKIKIALAGNCGALPLSRDSRRCIDAFLNAAAAEHDLSEIGSDDYDFDMARDCFLRLFYGGITATISPFVCFMLSRVLRQKCMDNTLKNFFLAERDRERCVRRMETLFERYDCLLAPVSATPAFVHRKPDRMRGIQPIYDSFDVDGVKTLYAKANLGYTTPFLTGNPIASMPIGITGEGLPVGIQVIGRHYGETELFDIVRRLNEQYAV